MFGVDLPRQAAVYCRVSSEVQQERQTIESQVDFAHKYCELNGIEITGIYRDDGITGTLPLQDRPAGSRLLSDARGGLFRLVLIFKLDRLGRSTRVILNAVHDLDSVGVKVRSMTEPFDTSDASGRFLLTILAGVADLERSNILQRMELGAARAAREGKWLGGIVPYGYLKGSNGFLEVNHEEIPGFDLSEPDVVQMMYRMCADGGSSTQKIADHLNAVGIPPAWVAHNLGGKRRHNTRAVWTAGRIRSILRSTTYKGIHYYGKRSPSGRELIPREVPAIVDADTWEKVQKTMDSNQIDAMRNAKHRYLLKSIIKCAHCGATYRGNPAGKKSKYGYYSCVGRSNWKQMGLGRRCFGMSINMAWLDDFVWRACLNYINHPQLVIQSIEGAMSSQNDEHEESLLRGRLTALDADHERMLDLYRQNLIGLSDLTVQLDKIKKDRQAVMDELAELRRQSPDSLFRATETAANMLELLQQAVNAPDVSFEVRQTVIRTMVDTITVSTDPGGATPRARITIHFRFHEDVPADFTRTVIRKDIRANNNAGIVTIVTNYPPAPEPGTTPRERLLYLRHRYNISQADAARIGGVSSASLSDLENGHSASLRRKFIKAISDHYGLPYSFLGAYDQLPDGTVAEKLLKGRLYRLYSLEQAAKYFGVSIKTYGLWEHGIMSVNSSAKKVPLQRLAEWIRVFAQ